MQDPKMLTISSEKTTRFHTWGNRNSAKHVWFVLHGYGQLSTYFIRKFRALDPNENFIVAPEGFHRFYLKGHSGRVGASWMTKEERINDISDYVRYLDKLADHIKVESFEKFHVIGFSQGAATASRWITQGKSFPNSLCLWASVFPPDLDFSLAQEKLKKALLVLVNGDTDEFYNVSDFNTHATSIKSLGITYEHIIFPGGHDININALKELSILVKKL